MCTSTVCLSRYPELLQCREHFGGRNPPNPCSSRDRCKVIKLPLLLPLPCTSLEIPLLTSHLQYNQGPTVPYVQAPFANYCLLFTFDIPHSTGFSVLLVCTSFLFNMPISFPKHLLSFPTKPLEGC